MKIELLYSCALCGLKRTRVKVTARGEDQGISEWMKTVGVELSIDHAIRSPGCRPKTLSEVMIPLPDEGDPIGKPRLS